MFIPLWNDERSEIAADHDEAEKEDPYDAKSRTHVLFDIGSGSAGFH